MINGGVGDTFQTGDTINGSGSTNRVDVTVANTTAAAPLVSISNVDAVNFRTLAAQTVNAQLFDRVGTVRSTGSTNVLTVNNGAIASTYALANSVATNADGLAVGIRGGDTTGASTTVNFTVANTGTANTAAAGAASNQVNSALSTTVTGIENVTLATTGANFVTFTGNTTATTDSASLVITGDGVNNITIANGGMATTNSVSAATATGALSLTIGTNLSTGDTYVGSTSTADTLRATVSGVVATGVNVSAFESFRMDSGAAGTVAFATNPAFTVVREDAVAAAGAAGGVHQLLNAGGFTTLNLVGNATTASATAGNNFSGITVTGGYAGAADTLTVNLSNGGVTLTAGGAYTVAQALTTSGIESYVINVNDTTANTNTTTFNNISDATTTSLTATSNGNIVFGNVGNIAGAAGVTGNLTTINLAGVTGTNAVTTLTTANNTLAAAALVTAGASGLTLTTGAETATDILTFTGSTGVDTLAAGAFLGNVVFNGGAGADVVTLGGAGAVSASLTTTGGTGNDLIAATNVTNVTITDFNGGDGLSLVADSGIVNSTAATVTVASSFTAVASVGNALATNVLFLQDAGAGAGTLTATFNLASAATTFNIGLAENGGAGALVGATINASNTASTITGSNAADTITGGAGNDSIANKATFAVGGSVATAADVINGGAGSDTISLYGSQAVGGGSAVNGAGNALAVSSNVQGFTVAGGVGVADVIALSDTVANYQTFAAAITNVQGAAAGAGATSIQSVQQSNGAAAIVAGTNLVKLTTAIDTTGLTVQQAFNAAIGTSTVTGLANTTGVLVSLYDALNQRAEFLIVNAGTGAGGNTLETADIAQLIGSVNMSAADYAAFNNTNFAQIA